jgi:hypothetical protein
LYHIKIKIIEMKNLLFKSLFLAGVLVVFGTACDPDPVVEENPPSLSLVDEAGFITTSATLDAGSTFSVKVSASADESPLNAFSVYEDGVKVSSDRLSVNGTPVASNPILLFDLEKNTFTWEVDVVAQDDASLRVYEFEVAAESGKTASRTVDITTTVGTAVDEITGVLLNQAGPAGTGGLDLDDGMGVGSLNAAAEIKDEGIDIGQPNATNWRQQISGSNGSVIKYLRAGENGLSESFSYDDVQYKEDIASLFTDNGIDFTLTNDNAELKSDVVNEGDVFVVERDGAYYLLYVVSIEVTADNNADNYAFDIKK